MIDKSELKHFLMPTIFIIMLLGFFGFSYYKFITNSNVKENNSSFEVHKVCGTEGMIKGIDVSYWQSTIDWDKVVLETDVDFAITRVSDGTQKIDPKFTENWKEIQRVGLIRGAYQFFRPNQDPVAQAELMLKLIDEAGGLEQTDLPPTIDIEVTGNMSSDVIVQGINDWAEYISAHTNRIPIIYTGPAFWDSAKLGNSYSEYPLWIAHYTNMQCPWAPDAWNHWEFWQFTGEGKLNGITRPVDINVFNGDLEGLKYFIKNSDIYYNEMDSGTEASDNADGDLNTADSNVPVINIDADNDAGLDSQLPNGNFGCSCSVVMGVK